MRSRLGGAPVPRVRSDEPSVSLGGSHLVVTHVSSLSV
jgi:hypothetical protein